MRRTLWAAMTLLVVGPVYADWPCRFEAQRTGGEAAQGINRVIVVARAGELRVLGARNARRIEATGRACASSAELLDQVTITTRREGSALYIEAVSPRATDLSGWFEASLDLAIVLPESIAVDAQDSSGDATFEDLHSLKLNDSSGNVRIRRIAGAIDLTDSSGNIDVDQAGSVRLVDSSGDIDIARTSRGVEIIADSSGDIRIRDVAGDVHVMQDSSGDIEIGDVKGNAAVDNDSSGRIVASHIGGNFSVLADSSGGISYRNVRGSVAIPGFTSESAARVRRLGADAGQ